MRSFAHLTHIEVYSPLKQLPDVSEQCLVSLKRNHFLMVKYQLNKKGFYLFFPSLWLTEVEKIINRDKRDDEETEILTAKYMK